MAKKFKIKVPAFKSTKRKAGILRGILNKVVSRGVDSAIKSVKSLKKFQRPKSFKSSKRPFGRPVSKRFKLI